MPRTLPQCQCEKGAKTCKGCSSDYKRPASPLDTGIFPVLRRNPYHLPHTLLHLLPPTHPAPRLSLHWSTFVQTIPHLLTHSAMLVTKTALAILFALPSLTSATGLRWANWGCSSSIRDRAPQTEKSSCSGFGSFFTEFGGKAICCSDKTRKP